MKGFAASVLLLSLLAWPALAPAQDPQPLAAAEALLPQHHALPQGPVSTLDELETAALAHNPEIKVAAARLAAVQARVPQAGALDDPMFSYRGWGVPFRQPGNFNAAQNMLMFTQTFPGPGKRGLRDDIAHTEVAEARAALEDARLRVRVEVRKAFYDLLRAEDGLRIHDEHVDIARQAVEAARIKYTVGKVPQQDMLKAQLALTKLAEHLIHFDQEADVARFRLNTLLGREPDAALNVQGFYAIPIRLPGTEELEKLALLSRPDLALAQAAAEKSRQQQALAGKTYVPDFTVSGGYMLMPEGAPLRNAYMIEGSINLPWLNRRKHDSELAAAKAEASERDAEVDALRVAAFGQIQEARAEARAAKQLADLYGDLLQPQALATLRSTVVAYEHDRTDFLNLLDSQITVVDVDLARLQAQADFEARFADLELAVGTPLDRDLHRTTEVRP